MTEKARKILRRMRRQPIPEVSDRILDEFNQSTLDDVGPVAGGDSESKFLRELQYENWSRGEE